MSEIAILASGFIAGLTVVIPLYVITSKWKKTLVSDAIDEFITTLSEKDVQNTVYQTGFLFASGAAKAIPMIAGNRGKKMTLEGIIMQGLGAVLENKLPQLLSGLTGTGQSQEQPQTSNTDMQ
jgi:hypothetical protein